MPNAVEKLMSLDEFLAWERKQPDRHEYVDGVIRMMTGASAGHVTIAMNLSTSLRAALRGSRCRPFGSDMKVIANGNIRYPDISIACSPVDDRADHLPEPVVVVEIISPSTAREDRGRKKLDYFATPSIRQYAIVEQDERLIDLYTRTDAGWIDEVVVDDGTLNLSAIGVAISLDEIYEDTELDATRRPADERPAPAA
ncbi:MAG TPA: Uma2 family endonuclease [Stellaceae bacterium]|nr:Uma2 family endonuclease [Stellaceae bacterium]